MLRFAIAVVAACVAPRAKPPSNTARRGDLIVVGSFNDAPWVRSGADCRVALGPHWPDGEDAIRAALRGQFREPIVFVSRDSARYVEPNVSRPDLVELKIGRAG